MSFPNSPGVYSRVKDKSFIVSGGGILSGGLVTTSDKGPLEPTTVTSTRDFIALYGEPNQDTPALYAGLRFLKKAGILTVVRVEGENAKTAEVVVGDGTESEIVTVSAKNPGTWGNDIRVSFQASESDDDNVFLTQVSVKDPETGEYAKLETFVTSRDPKSKDGYGNSQYIEKVVNEQSDYIDVSDNASVDVSYTLSGIFSSKFELSGGKNDYGSVKSTDIMEGWSQFENANEIPAKFLINAGWASPDVQGRMISVAQERNDAIAVLDVPKTVNNDVQGMIDYVYDPSQSDSSLNQGATHVAGIYGGWIKVNDTFTDSQIEVPPSGDVAGEMVQTIQNYSYWDAPAGLTRGVITDSLGPTKVFTDGDMDRLYTNNINPITTVGGQSTVIWGQKTLQRRASSLDRINAVNTLLYINNHVKDSLQPFVFQPNTKTTRANVNTLVSTFLENIKKRGGLYDYAVDTSTEVNTPQVINNNQLLVNIAIQIVQTAEFIRLTTTVKPSGVSLE